MNKFQKYFSEMIDRYHIVTIHLLNGEQFDIGQGGVDKGDVICLPTCLSVCDYGTIQDYPYHSIIKIDKYGDKNEYD